METRDGRGQRRKQDIGWRFLLVKCFTVHLTPGQPCYQGSAKTTLTIKSIWQGNRHHDWENERASKTPFWKPIFLGLFRSDGWPAENVAAECRSEAPNMIWQEENKKIHQRFCGIELFLTLHTNTEMQYDRFYALDVDSLWTLDLKVDQYPCCIIITRNKRSFCGKVLQPCEVIYIKWLVKVPQVYKKKDRIKGFQMKPAGWKSDLCFCPLCSCTLTLALVAPPA